MISRISLPAQHNGTVGGTLKAKHQSSRLLVVCHGYKSSQKHPAIEAITDGLYQKGHHVFSFDFSGTTELDLARQVQDIADVTAHFTRYKEVVLLAGSFGALSSAMAASMRMPKVGGLITLNGFFGFARLSLPLLRPYLMFRAAAFVEPRYKETWRFYRTHYQPARIQVPTLVMHSDVDKDVSPVQSQRFFAALGGQKQFAALQHADHDLTSKVDCDLVVDMIHTWLHNTNLPS